VPSRSYLDKDVAGGRRGEVGRAEMLCTPDDPPELARLGLSAKLAAHDESPPLEEVDESEPSRRLELEDALAEVPLPALVSRWSGERDLVQQGEELSMRRSVGDRDCIERLPDRAATAIIDNGSDDPRAARDDSEPHVNS